MWLSNCGTWGSRVGLNDCATWGSRVRLSVCGTWGSRVWLNNVTHRALECGSVIAAHVL